MGICGLGYLELRQDEREEKNTSGVQTRARKRAKTVKMSDTSEEPYPYLLLENIPSLLTVHNILTRLSPEDLCTFARCSRANKTLVSVSPPMIRNVVRSACSENPTYRYPSSNYDTGIISTNFS